VLLWQTEQLSGAPKFEGGGGQGAWHIGASKFDCRWNVKQVQTAAASGNRPNQLKPQKAVVQMAGKIRKMPSQSPRGVGKTYGKLDPMTLIVQLGGLFGGELFR